MLNFSLCQCYENKENQVNDCREEDVIVSNYSSVNNDDQNTNDIENKIQVKNQNEIQNQSQKEMKIFTANQKESIQNSSQRSKHNNQSESTTRSIVTYYKKSTENEQSTTKIQTHKMSQLEDDLRRQVEECFDNEEELDHVQSIILDDIQLLSSIDHSEFLDISLSYASNLSQNGVNLQGDKELLRGMVSGIQGLDVNSPSFISQMKCLDQKISITYFKKEIKIILKNNYINTDKITLDEQQIDYIVNDQFKRADKSLIQEKSNAIENILHSYKTIGKYLPVISDIIPKTVGLFISLDSFKLMQSITQVLESLKNILQTYIDNLDEYDSYSIMNSKKPSLQNQRESLKIDDVISNSKSNNQTSVNIHAKEELEKLTQIFNNKKKKQHSDHRDSIRYTKMQSNEDMPNIIKHESVNGSQDLFKASRRNSARTMDKYLDLQK